jgi:hypothetical protein
MWLYLIVGAAMLALLVVLCAFASLVLSRKRMPEPVIPDSPGVDWHRLCEQAASERDFQKLLALTDQINRQLERKLRQPKPANKLRSDQGSLNER